MVSLSVVVLLDVLISTSLCQLAINASFYFLSAFGSCLNFAFGFIFLLQTRRTCEPTNCSTKKKKEIVQLFASASSEDDSHLNVVFASASSDNFPEDDSHLNVVF